MTNCDEEFNPHMFYRHGKRAFQVDVTWQPPDRKFRDRRIVLVICDEIEEAIAAVKRRFPDDPYICSVTTKFKDAREIIMLPGKDEP